MDSAAVRQKVLSNNLANANTPNYLRKDVRFTEALSKAIDHGDVAIQQVEAEVYEDMEATVNAKGNSVSLQKELGAIAQNELLYNFAAEMTNQKFAGLRKAINGTK